MNSLSHSSQGTQTCQSRRKKITEMEIGKYNPVWSLVSGGKKKQFKTNYCDKFLAACFPDGGSGGSDSETCGVLS